MMYCEICGRPIEKGYLTKIEGSVLLLCESCAERGEVIRIVKEKSQKEAGGTTKSSILVEDFDKRIRKARKELKIDLKELSKLTKIPVKALKMIEKGEIYPDEEQVVALEKALRIELLESQETGTGSKGFTLTLGDVVRIRD